MALLRSAILCPELGAINIPLLRSEDPGNAAFLTVRFSTHSGNPDFFSNALKKPKRGPRGFGFVKSRVVLGVATAGRTVVAAVARVMTASVWFGRMLVSISVETPPALNFTVPASPLTEPDSLSSAVPSARQKTSASSFSTRLQLGQRFIIQE